MGGKGCFTSPLRIFVADFLWVQVIFWFCPAFGEILFCCGFGGFCGFGRFGLNKFS